jgi:hypothetical protein
VGNACKNGCAPQPRRLAKAVNAARVPKMLLDRQARPALMLGGDTAGQRAAALAAALMPTPPLRVEGLNPQPWRLQWCSSRQGPHSARYIQCGCKQSGAIVCARIATVQRASGHLQRAPLGADVQTCELALFAAKQQGG